MSRTRKIVLISLMASFVVLATYVLRIPTGIGSAYIHLGDSVIIFAGSVLGAPFGAVAGAVGSGLTDFLVGANIYVLPTVLIKGCMGFVAGKLLYKQSSVGILRCIVAAVICEVIMVVGYFIANTIILGLTVAISGVLYDLIQMAGGVVGGVALVKLKGVESLRL